MGALPVHHRLAVARTFIPINDFRLLGQLFDIKDFSLYLARNDTVR